MVLGPSEVAAQTKCGVQRWPVKIWADDDAARVDTVPVPITVAELARLPRPETRFPQRSRVPGIEFQTFVLRARFVTALPRDDDSDIHLVVRDLEIDEAMLVTEIPHPGCTADERLARVFDEARQALRTVPRDAVIEIVGLGFFDTLHGQRGMAPNGLEIHPVLSLRVSSPAPGDTASAQMRSLLGDSVALADSVWVNTSSGVYHCPGAQWFGRTVRGRFLTEHDPRQSGAAGGWAPVWVVRGVLESGKQEDCVNAAAAHRNRPVAPIQ